MAEGQENDMPMYYYDEPPRRNSPYLVMLNSDIDRIGVGKSINQITIESLAQGGRDIVFCHKLRASKSSARDGLF